LANAAWSYLKYKSGMFLLRHGIVLPVGLLLLCVLKAHLQRACSWE